MFLYLLTRERFLGGNMVRQKERPLTRQGARVTSRSCTGTSFASGAQSRDSASGPSLERPGMWVSWVTTTPVSASRRAISAMIFLISIALLDFFAIEDREPRLSENSSKIALGPTRCAQILSATNISRASQSVMNAGSPVAALKTVVSYCWMTSAK